MIEFLLLTNLALSIILVGLLLRLFTRPSSINVNFPSVKIDPISLHISPKPLEVEESPLAQSPMPLDLVEYLEQESDSFAIAGRKSRARSLYAELGDWDMVFSVLRREDSFS